jgi:hypothetical protein
MRFVRGLIVFPLILFISSTSLRAQKAKTAKQPRILILLDGSSSMVDKWDGGKSRFKAAEDVILSLMDSVYRVNKDVEFGLRVFGHQHSVTEKNCFDTKTEVYFTKDNRDQMSLRLSDIRPYGITPIAYSIRRAVEDDMVDEQKYIYSLVLITDGGESCGGNICEVVKSLLEKKIYFKPYIVSLYQSQELAESYACMGQYMQVSKPEDIRKTVATIVDAYRPMFKPDNADLKPLQSDMPKPVAERKELPVIPKPVAKQEEPEEKIAVKIPEQAIEKPVIKPIEKPIRQNTEKIDLPTASVARKKEKPVAVYSSRPAMMLAKPFAKPVFAPVALPKTGLKEPVERQDVAMARLATVGKPRKMSLLFTVPTFKEVRLPKIAWKEIKEDIVTEPAPKEEPKTTGAKPKPGVRATVIRKDVPKKETPAPAKKDEVEFKVETEDAEETTVEVYFTNGKGKYYSMTPQVLFKDVVLGNVVQKFYRTVDANNKPDPQKVLAGKYNVMIAGRANSQAKNVVISPGKTNKIIITVTSGSFHFQYNNNPDRPVSEYEARIAQRSGNIDRTQPCDQDLKYEPGSYHITINTKPLTHKYVDLGIGEQVNLSLDEPGFVQFSNSSKAVKAELYSQLGDRFVKFMGVDLNGPADSMKVDLVPGPYEVHFTPDPKMGREQIIPFRVKSNDTTAVELK